MAGDLENRVQALRLELREGRLAESMQHVEEALSKELLHLSMLTNLLLHARSVEGFKRP